MIKADVDIDVKPTSDIAGVFNTAVRASLDNGGKLAPHPCGYYFQHIAVDPATKLAAVPYQEAEELGYLKVDFLHNHVYSHFQSKEEIDALLELEPPWHFLRSPKAVAKLFQLGKQFDLVSAVKPTCIEELADVLALIRPGKRELLDAYLKNREAIRPILYQSAGGYSFKKSHAFGYALVIVLQLHLLELDEDLLAG